MSSRAYRVHPSVAHSLGIAPHMLSLQVLFVYIFISFDSHNKVVFVSSFIAHISLVEVLHSFKNPARIASNLATISCALLSLGCASACFRIRLASFIFDFDSLGIWSTVPGLAPDSFPLNIGAPMRLATPKGLC